MKGCFRAGLVVYVSRERQSREMGEIRSLLLGQYYADFNDIIQFLAVVSKFHIIFY